MQTYSDFDKYIAYLTEIKQRTELAGFYSFHSNIFLFFKTIDKSVQDMLRKPAIDPVFFKQLENALPVLTKLKNEITTIDTNNLIVPYKDKVEKIIGYTKDEMSITKINGTHKQLCDFLKENDDEVKRRQEEIKRRQKEIELNERYIQLVQEFDKATTEREYLDLADKFRFGEMKGFLNSEEFASKCLEKYRSLKRREKVEQQAREKKIQEIEHNAKFQGCISAGYHTVGLKTDGTVVAVGNNEYGQCNVSRWYDIVAFSSNGRHTVGLKVDGTVVAVGNNEYGQCNVSSWYGIIAISTNPSRTVGLRADGTVVAVGDNKNGQCKTDNWRDIVAIDSSGCHTVGLKADGTVVAVGNNEYGQCNVSGWYDIVSISADDYITVGLRADGKVVAIGNNIYGECNVSSWYGIVAVSTSSHHTVGLKADGTVVAVGYNKDGRCKTDNWRDIVAVSVGIDCTVGLKSDGTVVAVGDNREGQCETDNWRDIVAIDSCGHTVGLKADGTVVVGYYDYSRCNTISWRNIGPVDKEQVLKRTQTPSEPKANSPENDNSVDKKKLQWVPWVCGIITLIVLWRFILIVKIIGAVIAFFVASKLIPRS